MNFSVPEFRKSSLIAMEYIQIHAIKSTNEIIFQSWFLGIFKDILFQSLPFFLFKDLLDHKYYLFNSMDVFQVTIVGRSWQRFFWKKNYFSSKSYWIVYLNSTSKGVVNPIFSKNKLLQEHVSKIWTQFVCEINRTSMYFTEQIVSSTLIFQNTFRRVLL